MAIRSVGSVSIAFGMVSIPVKLYSATENNALNFHLMHAGCGSRLKQQYVCLAHNTVVERADMVKGYEIAKEQYVTFTSDELKALEEKGSGAIEITEFVPGASVDPIYFDKTYFLGPDKGGAKPYALLANVMRKTGKTALGRYASRGKQHVVMLRAIEGGIVMQQLLQAAEVRSIGLLEIAPAEVNAAEIALAEQLVNAISNERFEPQKYKDEVRERIETVIAAKAAGKQVSISAEPAPSTPVIDLMGALRASLSAAAPAQQPEPKKAKGAKSKVA